MVMETHFHFKDSLLLLPREKIESQGVLSLTTEELIHTIIGSGSRLQNVQTLAKKISQKMQQKKTLQLNDLLIMKGVGKAKACQIIAAVELVERMRPIGSPVLDSLQKVLLQLSELRFLPREHIVCLYLNARMQLLLKETISIGSVNQSVISPRDIFSVIKYHPVSYLILAHNHPSGVALPSQEDIFFTQTTRDAGHLLGLELLDHVIVAKEEHYSFREQRTLQEKS